LIVTPSDETETVWDLYREIHEAVRDALFGVTTLAGQADAAGPDAVRRLLDAWRRVTLALDGHHSGQPPHEQPMRHRAHAGDAASRRRGNGLCREDGHRVRERRDPRHRLGAAAFGLNARPASGRHEPLHLRPAGSRLRAVLFV
jgi:hypothetical protein